MCIRDSTVLCAVQSQDLDRAGNSEAYSRTRTTSCRVLGRASGGLKIKARVQESIKTDLNICGRRFRICVAQPSPSMRCAALKAQRWRPVNNVAYNVLQHWNGRYAVCLNIFLVVLNIPFPFGSKSTTFQDIVSSFIFFRFEETNDLFC